MSRGIKELQGFYQFTDELAEKIEQLLDAERENLRNGYKALESRHDLSNPAVRALGNDVINLLRQLDLTKELATSSRKEGGEEKINDN
jgi:hypothetical protein